MMTFNPLLSKASSELNKPVFLLGDFNIDLLAHDTDKIVSNCIDILSSLSLLPHIILPTRVTGTTSKVIDNIFFKTQLNIPLCLLI